MRFPLKLVFIALASLSAGASAQTTHVVAADGSGDFTSISTALTVALDGDALLVKPGNYTGFTVDAQSVSIVADGPGALVQGLMVVQNLGANQRVVLQGLIFDALALPFNLEGLSLIHI